MSDVGIIGVAEANTALKALAKFPIGWTESFTSWNWIGWPIVGWLITSIFALFGAPFWFDVLKRCVNLRGTGPRPDGNGDKPQA